MTIEEFNKIQSEIPDSVLTERARELISKLCNTDGGKIKGWMFEFTDENLNFTV